MANKAENNEQTNADMPVGKEEILRAQDIIPKSPSADERQQEDAIPNFDLAKKLMAAQRRATSTRRKKTGKNVETQKTPPQAEPVRYTIEQPMSISAQQDRIIAEIVARDIERLYRGDTL